MTTKALQYRNMAYPSGLVFSLDEKTLFVSETCANKVHRIIINEDNQHFMSTFYDFSGRFGPMDLQFSVSNLLYVSRYEFQQLSGDGMVSVLNMNGQLVENIMITGCPEISNIHFNKVSNTTMYLCDESQSVYKIYIESEEKNEKEKL